MHNEIKLLRYYACNFLSYRTNLTKLDEKVSICNMEKKLWAKVTNSTEILCKYLIFMQETFSIQNSAVSLISESTISY